MKAAVTVISGVCVGLLMAFNGLTPLIQAKTIFENRKRVIFSGALVAAAFMLFMSAFILASIDLALQWEVQGFIIWEAILTVATGFAILALVCLIAAKLVFPKPQPDMFATLGKQMGFGELNLPQLIEVWMKEFQAAPADEAGRAPQEGRTPQEGRSPQSQSPVETQKAVREEIKERPRSDIGIEAQVGLVH